MEMIAVEATFIPKLRIEAQNHLRFDVAQDNLNIVKNRWKLSLTIITGNELRVYEYYPGTKYQYSRWTLPEEPRTKFGTSRLSTHALSVFCHQIIDFNNSREQASTGRLENFKNT